MRQLAEKVTEKIGAVVKKLESEAEMSQSLEERRSTTKRVVDAIRGLKAFELSLRDHANVVSGGCLL